VKTANRRRSAGRRTTRKRAGGAVRTSARPADAVAVDTTLDRLLINRGWTLVERSWAGDVYDWLASAPNPDHEVTYLIVPANHALDHGPAYRVRLVDGQRLAYDTAACLAADLDGIEARRCRC
jgi:hypothetical protein